MAQDSRTTSEDGPRPGVLEVWKLHREYVLHEDGLVNHRTTWGITIQSFVIATFGFSYQKKYEIEEKITQTISRADILGMADATREYNLFLIFLPVVGAITALITFLSVNAAVHALNHLRADWDSYIEHRQDQRKFFPGLRGGRRGGWLIGAIGNWLPRMLPLFFVIFWTYVLFFVLSLNFEFHISFPLRPSSSR